MTLTDANDASVTAKHTAGRGDWIGETHRRSLMVMWLCLRRSQTTRVTKSLRRPVTIDLDTTADAEDGIDLAVAVDSVINDEESGNVTLTLSGVDADAERLGHIDRQVRHCRRQRRLTTTVTGR